LTQPDWRHFPILRKRLFALFNINARSQDILPGFYRHQYSIDCDCDSTDSRCKPCHIEDNL